MVVLYAFESIRTSFLTAFESFWTFCGGEAFLIAVIAVIYWCIDKKFARRIGFSVILAGNLSFVLKNTICSPRPWIADPSFKPADTFLLGGEGYAFPSLYTCRSTCLSVNFFYRYRKSIIRLLALLVMIMVPVSRLYLGTTTLSGVLFSFAASMIISIGLNRFIDGMVLDSSHYPMFCLIFCALPVFSFIIFLSLYYSGIIDYKTGSAAVRMAGASIAFALSWLFEMRFVRFNEKCDHTWKQLLKAAIGIALIIILKVGLDIIVSLFGAEFWPGEFMEYFIIVFISMAVYPVFFRTYFSSNYYSYS